MSRPSQKQVQERYDRLAKSVDRLRTVVKQRDRDEREWAARGKTYTIDDLIDAEKEVDKCVKSWKKQQKDQEKYTA